MKKKQAKIKAPIECATFNDICSMSRDNINLAKDYWMIYDGYEITIAQQKPGNKSSQKVSIPRKLFNQCVKWYLTGNKNGKLPVKIPKNFKES